MLAGSPAGCFGVNRASKLLYGQAPGLCLKGAKKERMGTSQDKDWLVSILARTDVFVGVTLDSVP